MKTIFSLLAALAIACMACVHLTKDSQTSLTDQFMPSAAIVQMIPVAHAQEEAPDFEIDMPVEPPASVEDAASLLPALIDAIVGGKWLLAIAIGGMILTTVFRQILLPKLNFTTSVLPWVNLGIVAVLAYFGHLMVGLTVNEAAVAILISGGLGAHLWSLGGKYVMDFILKVVGNGLAKQ